MRRTLLLFPLLLAAAVALDNVGVAGCGPEARPSSIAWDGASYTAVWASPSTFNVTVWAAQFRADDFGPGGLATNGAGSARTPEGVLKVSSVIGAPEVVHGDRGFLVLVHGGDHKLYAVPLDPKGARTRDARVIAEGVDLLCVRPVWSGDKYYASFAIGRELHLVGLDRDGAITWRDKISVAPPSRCAMAAGDGRVAVVASGRASQAAVQRAGPALVIQTPGDGGPLRLSRRTGGWAMLYGDDGATEVVYLTDDGGREKGDRLPASVDPGSVDLARNDAGHFVSWLDRREVRFGFIGDDKVGHFDNRRGAVGTRAIGHDDVCAITWTAGGGNRVWVLRVSECHP